MIIRQRKRGGRLIRLISVTPRRLAALYLGVAALLVAGLGYELSLLYSARNSLEQAAASTPKRELHVVSRLSLNTYYQSDNGPTGFEYALLKRFAESLDLELKIHTANSLNELFDLVSSGQVAFASAGLTPTPERKRNFYFSRPYLKDQPVLVYKVGQYRPRNYRDLEGKEIVVIANSSHSATLNNIRQQDVPELGWRELENINFYDLLSRVEKSEVDYTIIDSSEFALHQGAFPSLKRALDVGSEQEVSWMFARDEMGKYLQRKADHFIGAIQKSGELAKLEERFFGQSQHVSQVAANEFAKNIRRRLPEYIGVIKESAAEAEMDWRLLAAISYQESGWNPKARSPTGVRGMMMLTLPTARELGIANRLDVEQSLAGGARYYLRLKQQLPQRIQEPDRSWFALAAYNVGAGHLEDARRITQSRGEDPDSWYHVKKALPLLSDPNWYKHTRYGYARGHEPVRYVQQVRHYYNVLRLHDISRLSRNEIDRDSNSVSNQYPAQASLDSRFGNTRPSATGDSLWPTFLAQEPSSELLISEVLAADETATPGSAIPSQAVYAEDPTLELASEMIVDAKLNTGSEAAKLSAL